MSHAVKDTIIIAVSIVAAVILAKLGVVRFFVESLGGGVIVGSFIAGLFFTSFFTTPLAIVALAELAAHSSPVLVAFIGGFGALLGDLFLFSVFDGHVSRDVQYLLKHYAFKGAASIFHSRIFRWVTPLIGALIIASPFPDEFGIAMMGLSHTRLATLIPISYTMNTIGILVVGLAASSL